MIFLHMIPNKYHRLEIHDSKRNKNTQQSFSKKAQDIETIYRFSYFCPHSKSLLYQSNFFYDTLNEFTEDYFYCKVHLTYKNKEFLNKNGIIYKTGKNSSEISLIYLKPTLDLTKNTIYHEERSITGLLESYALLPRYLFTTSRAFLPDPEYLVL